MKAAITKSDLRLSPKYCLRDWPSNFQTEADWLKAINIVEDRIRGRFVQWVDHIINKPFSGFAVLALDCLLLETIVGFQEGHRTQATQVAYVSVLTRPPFSFDRGVAESFCKNIRNGIIHDTETRRKWIIRMVRQNSIVREDDDGNFILNRTMFHAALKDALTEWLDGLRSGDKDAREKMKARMEEIIDIHYAE